MVSGPRLDTLPLELRERIVSLGSFPTLLQISLTNKALRQACQSVSVIKAILHNRNGCGGAVWHVPYLSTEAPVEDWARYALAEYRATYLTRTQYPDLVRQGKEMSWLPQLMILQHPNVKGRRLVSPHLAEDGNNFLRLATAFCIVMTALMLDRRIESTTSLTRNLTVENARMSFLDCLSLQTLGTGGPVERVPRSKELTIKAYADAYVAHAYFVRDLREKLAPRLRLGTMVDYVPSPHTLAIPGSDSIPFQEFMDLPIPFSDKDLSRFATCHLPQMTDPAFLQDGSEWGWVLLASAVSSATTVTVRSVRQQWG
ncbi:MAG: hypothetical protein Q9168_003572 [Polycauliona sp. 1 TL-2023]